MTQRTPIVRDVADGFTLDNRGAPAYALRTVEPIRAYLPPPPLRRANRLRRVALRRVAILAAVIVQASVGSHMPARFRYYSLLHGRMLDDHKPPPSVPT